MELKIKAVLDPQFAPMSLKVREMRELTKENGQEIVTLQTKTSRKTNC